MREFDDFNDLMMIKFSNFYISQIFQPMMKIKQVNINFFDLRKDYEQIMVIKNNQKVTMEKELANILRAHADKKCGNITET